MLHSRYMTSCIQRDIFFPTVSPMLHFSWKWTLYKYQYSSDLTLTLGFIFISISYRKKWKQVKCKCFSKFVYFLLTVSLRPLTISFYLECEWFWNLSMHLNSSGSLLKTAEVWASNLEFWFRTNPSNSDRKFWSES